jgi:hypothetical protein
MTTKGDSLALLDDFLSSLDVNPHPALVAIQKPTAAEMATAIAIYGLFPDEPWLRPVPSEGSRHESP